MKHEKAARLILSRHPSACLGELSVCLVLLLTPNDSSKADGLHAAPQSRDCGLAALLKKDTGLEPSGLCLACLFNKLL